MELLERFEVLQEERYKLEQQLRKVEEETENMRYEFKRRLDDAHSILPDGTT